MQINKKLGLFVGVVLGVLALTSCEKYTKETNAKIETTLERAEEALQQAQVPDIPEPVDTVRSKNDIWLGNQSVKIMEGDALPAWAEKDDGITISIAEEETLPVLAQELTDMTGISVRLDDLKAENAVPTETVPVNYSGKLSGLLNYISNRYGVWWRYRGGVITFYTKETRVFTLYALPNETQMDASIQGASMGANGSTEGNSSSNLSTSANLALWDSIEKGIEQVVGDEGKLSFSRATGTVTVTASPFVMRKVASYINNWNEKMSRQVAISVKILQVEINAEDNYGLDLKAVFNSNKLSGNYYSPYFIDAAAGSGTSGVAGLLSMTLIDPNSRWKDSGAIIQALSTQGKTSLVTSSSVTTLNNKIAPVQISTSENYVKETNVTTNGSGTDRNTEVDYETDTLNYGFTMEILPRILDHGRLIVLFSLNLTDLISLTTFSSSGTNSNDNNNSDEDENEDEDDDDNTGDTDQSIVQLPKMQMRGFMQEIAMRSGSTLVLTGFESVQNQTETSGIGKAKMSLLGGKSYSKRVRNVLVILLTPEVLESPLSPETRMRDF